MAYRLYPLSSKTFVHSSQYHQKMRMLSCKIFNDFYVPELTREELDYGQLHEPVQKWMWEWYTNYVAHMRHQAKPWDLDPEKNREYYPPHPQIRALTHQLREYGLYRDEHRDFNEEMKALAISRGKTFRSPGGNPDSGKKKK